MDGPGRDPGEQALRLNQEAPSLSRRTVLASARSAGLLVLLGLQPALAGCQGTPPGSAPRGTAGPPSATTTALAAAIARARHGIELWDRLATGRPGVGTLAPLIVADHREHLRSLENALGAASTVPDASPTTSPTGGDSTAPAPSVGQARNEELTGAAEAAAGVGGTSPAIAALLTEVAASRAVHADLLARADGSAIPGPITLTTITAAATRLSGNAATSPPSGVAAASGAGLAQTPTGPPAPSATTPSATTPVVDAEVVRLLQRLLTGEHAAVYAYGILCARCAPPLQPEARHNLAAHTMRRNEIRDLLTAGSVTPVAALPAYAVGTLTSVADVSDLGVKVESEITALDRSLVVATSETRQVWATVLTIEAARRQAFWSAKPIAFPGA